MNGKKKICSIRLKNIGKMENQAMMARELKIYCFTHCVISLFHLSHTFAHLNFGNFIHKICTLLVSILLKPVYLSIQTSFRKSHSEPYKLVADTFQRNIFIIVYIIFFFILKKHGNKIVQSTIILSKFCQMKYMRNLFAIFFPERYEYPYKQSQITTAGEIR